MSSFGKLAGKVALITGAANGIGQAYAQRLAEDGADIIIADLADSYETVEIVKATGRQALGIVCDISEPAGVDALAKKAYSEFPKIDILVNNAAIYPVQAFETITFVEWRRMMAINLDAQFLTCQAFLPGMRQQKWGRIVNIASSVVLFTNFDYTHYTTSKAAVVGFTRALASEVGNEGVTVNALAPGLIKTSTTGETHGKAFEYFANLQAISRPGMPSDLVGPLSFLVSDDAAWVTGQVLNANGGMIKVGYVAS